MIEKRRSTRIPVQIHLSITDIYKQDNSGIHNLSAPIEVTDISVHGLGLITECILPLNYYFNASLILDEIPSPIQTIVKIIRMDVLDKDLYRYGCEFSGLSHKAQEALAAYWAANPH